MNSLFQQVLSALKQNITADIVTLVDAPPDYQEFLGDMLLMLPDRTTQGNIINCEISSAVKAALACREWEKPQLVELNEYGIRVFWNRTEHKRKAVIAGGGHISLPLSQLLSLADFEVTVIDDRPEFANQVRFPGADHIFCEGFTQALRKVPIDDATAVIIVTRGHRYDLDCLRAVIHSDACYMGMIGSQRRIRSLIEQMMSEGLDASALERLHAPIGLDIGAQTPAEIAISIAAEIIAVFRGGTCRPLSSKAGETRE